MGGRHQIGTAGDIILECWAASPGIRKQQLDFIKRAIDRSDYYVVIVAGRYGSLADDSVSFTEKEYEYAVEKKIPVLAFLHKDPEQLEAWKTERESGQRARLELFRTRLKTSRLVSFWADKGDLSTKVLTAVMQAVNLSPGIGWVRGDQAIDPKVLQDTERLRIENAELKQRLAEIRSEQVTFPQGLIGPDETIELTVSGYIQNNQQKETLPDQQAIVKLGDLFVYIFDRLLVEPIEHALKTIVGRAAAAVGLSNSFREKAVYSIGSRDVRTLRFQYEALGLIQAQGQVSVQPFRQEYVAWTVTEKGRRYVAQTMAIRRAGA